MKMVKNTKAKNNKNHGISLKKVNTASNNKIKKNRNGNTHGRSV